MVAPVFVADARNVESKVAGLVMAFSWRETLEFDTAVRVMRDWSSA